MPNVFLYSPSNSEGYQRMAAQLSQLCRNGSLVILPHGSKFNSPQSLRLRTHDILILFAATEVDLDELISMRDDYASYRILLILKEMQQLDYQRFMLLSPRIIHHLDAEDSPSNKPSILKEFCEKLKK